MLYRYVYQIANCDTFTSPYNLKTKLNYTNIIITGKLFFLLNSSTVRALQSKGTCKFYTVSQSTKCKQNLNVTCLH